MEDVKVFRLSDTDSVPLVAEPSMEAGWIKRIIYPHHVNTKGLIFGVLEVNPGRIAHPWHNHIAYKAPGIEITYPEDFEEVYHIISGNGVVQWKTRDGKMREEKISAGDTLFFPIGVAEHQVINNDTEQMILVLCGSPTPSVKVSLSSKSA